MIPVKRALISVSDKSGVVDLARFLAEKNVEILSTGGTLKALQDAGVAARPIEAYTGFPEMMDGRLKTLHPKIHGGLLALRDKPAHAKAMEEHEIGGIDLLVVNLYPFAATIAKEGVSRDEAIENIDIGGPTMLRAAAKNYRFTASVCEPARYNDIIKEIETNGGISEDTSFELAREVFNHTASYDALISNYLNKESNIKIPDSLTMTYRRVQPLRYGENPHQNAAFYRPVLDLVKEEQSGLSSFEQLQGKELSFNNILDFSSALTAALSLPTRGTVIVKHLNPCGAAIVSNGSGDLAQSFIQARACDPVSAFGGVIAINGTVDKKIAELITENFTEGVVAPEITAEAKEVFATKKNLRLIRVTDTDRYLEETREIRQVYNGILYQALDNIYAPVSEWKCVTEKQPDEPTLKALELAWRLVKHVKSNAIIFCSPEASLGIGAGQMSRVDSVEIAVSKAAKSNLDLKGSVVASDAFFPFRDGVDGLAKAGAKAVVQPGGSMRDQEVIDACNEQGLIMMFTGMRHFRH